MSEQIVQLTAADFEDAMDFLNLVFGTHGPHDFETLLPAIYQRTDDLMACNHAVRVDGRIRAIVGVFPLAWQVGDTTLRVAGIGGVSTHPRVRGAGYMKTLMSRCVDLMRAQGYHLSYLGGQRQRYQYFGYERCGTMLSYALNSTNTRHAFAGADTGIRFEPIGARDSARLERARALHDAQALHAVRSAASFHNHLHNWHNKAHAALDANGTMVGYLVATPRGDRLDEVVAERPETAELIVRAWLTAGAAGSLSVDLPPTQAALGRSLGRWCERAGVNPAANFQVFAWPQVLSALLRARGLSAPLVPGRVVLGIGGQRFELCVEANSCTCAATTAAPHVEWDELTALRALFGPLAASAVAEIPGPAAVLEQWCPLPLHWPHQDGV